MGLASEKRRKILEAARRVFARKGYAAVTMQDLVEEAGVSRGGIYLYFEQVGQVFLAVLAQEGAAEDREEAGGGRPPGGQALLALFLEEFAKDLFSESSLSRALYEYHFAAPERGWERPFVSQFADCVEVISRLLALGVRQGQLGCRDVPGTARHIMYTLEGLRLGVLTLGLDKAAGDREMAYILEGLYLEGAGPRQAKKERARG